MAQTVAAFHAKRTAARSSGAAWPFAAAAAITGAVHLWRFWLLRVRYFDLDEFEHLHAAWYVSRGAVPYRDFFEHHTPGIYYTLAPFFRLFDVSGDAGDAIRFLFFARTLMWGLSALLLVLVFLLAARWRGVRLGAVATLLLATTVMFLQKTLEVRPDVPALALCLAGLLLLIAAVRAESAGTPRPALVLAAGLSLGCGLLFTQKLLFILPGIAAALLAGRSGAPGARTWHLRLRPALLFAAGIALPILLVLAAFTAAGALRDFVHFNLLYNLGYESVFPATRYLRELLQQNPLLMVLAAAGLLLAAARIRAGTDAPGTLLLVLCTLSLAAGLFIIPAPFPQYLLLALPLLAIFAADALVAGWDAAAARWESRLPRRFHGIGLAMLLLLATLHPLLQIHRIGGPDWAYGKEIARLRYVHENTDPEDTVLGGWTAGAGVFRPHAFFYFYFSTRQLVDQVPEDARRRLAKDLRSGAVEPALVLYDVRLKGLSEEVNAYLESEYEPVPGQSLVWQRKRPDSRETTR